MAIEKYSDSLPTVRADCDEWTEYLGINPSPSTLAEVGISAAIWRAIRAGRRPLVPLACWQLACWHRYFNLADVLGRAWEGFVIAGEALIFPGLKYPLPAAELRAAWFKFQEIARLHSEVMLLRHDLALKEVENAELVRALSARTYRHFAGER